MINTISTYMLKNNTALLIIVFCMRLAFSSKVGISFSPAGLLTPFHLGAVYQLRKCSMIDCEVTLAGSSGGALAAVTTALNIDEYSSLQSCVEIAKFCRENGAFASLRGALDEQMHKILPLDAHKMLNERAGRTLLAYRQIYPSNVPSIVSFFDSYTDLCDVLRASCTIPVWFSGYPAVKVRDGFGVDGIFAVDFSRFGCPDTNTNIELLICPFTVGLTPSSTSGKRIDVISPALLAPEDWPFSSQQLIQLALAPPGGRQDISRATDSAIENVYSILFSAGRKSVLAWEKGRQH